MTRLHNQFFPKVTSLLGNITYYKKYLVQVLMKNTWGKKHRNAAQIITYSSPPESVFEE
jgi:hypothetical protein